MFGGKCRPNIKTTLGKISIKMKRKVLTETFMMISNCDVVLLNFRILEGIDKRDGWQVWQMMAG